MSLLGSAVLVNWGGIVKSKEKEYNEWLEDAKVKFAKENFKCEILDQ